MKKILISIQPQWVEKILNGEKTIEIRKTIPKCDFPIKVYIYCTKNGELLRECIYPNEKPNNREFYIASRGIDNERNLNGKVVAEFTLNKVDAYYYGDLSYPIPSYEGDTSIKELPDGYFITSGDLKKCCLTYEELLKYGNKKTLYGWKIDNLKIYDEPKELSEFYNINKMKKGAYNYYQDIEVVKDMSINELVKLVKYIEKKEKRKLCRLTKAPQSWCYVEEV